MDNNQNVDKVMREFIRRCKSRFAAHPSRNRINNAAAIEASRGKRPQEEELVNRPYIAACHFMDGLPPPPNNIVVNSSSCSMKQSGGPHQSSTSSPSPLPTPLSSSSSSSTSTTSTSSLSLSLSTATSSSTSASSSTSSFSTSSSSQCLSSRIASARMGALGHLNKVRLMGELLEVIETLHSERQFCDYIKQRLLAYRRNNYCETEPLIYGNKEDAASLGLSLSRFRFAEAITYLDKYIGDDPEIYKITEECLHKFKVRRTAHCKRSGETQHQICQILDKLVPVEAQRDMKIKMRNESHEFDVIKRLLSETRSDIQRMDISDNGLNKVMEMVQHMTAKLCILMPFPVPSTKRWMIMRNESIHDISHRISEDLNMIYNEVQLQQQRLLHEQRLEREKQCGRLVQLTIIKAPQKSLSLLDQENQPELQMRPNTKSRDASGSNDSDHVVRFNQKVHVMEY